MQFSIFDWYTTPCGFVVRHTPFIWLCSLNGVCFARLAVCLESFFSVLVGKLFYSHRNCWNKGVRWPAVMVFYFIYFFTLLFASYLSVNGIGVLNRLVEYCWSILVLAYRIWMRKIFKNRFRAMVRSFIPHSSLPFPCPTVIRSSSFSLFFLSRASFCCLY